MSFRIPFSALSPVVFISIALSIPSLGNASSRDEAIESYLKHFQSNPSQALNGKLLRRANPGTSERATGTAGESVKTSDGFRQLLQQKDRIRKKIIEDSGKASEPGRAPYQGNDLVEDLVELPKGRILRTLEEMERADLLKSILQEKPWSDDYWPTYKGQLGARYGVPTFKNSKFGEDWSKYREWAMNPKNASSTDDLSPAEKYDLLVGDANRSLTTRMWEEGNWYYENDKKVATWMGICHGTAASAYMAPRPAQAITLSTPEGSPIRFYPADMKALVSLLWANTRVSTNFAGGRCNIEKPKMDSNGRVQDQDCFDTNPGTWHMAVVNRIGKEQKSFVIDATYDLEVWNYPVSRYRYSYFNPETGKSVKSLEKARVELKNFTKDKFQKYRSKDAVAVVGIAMDIDYTVATQPTQALRDSAEDDLSETVRYMYDLELDRDGQIIGGEWYTNKHPDFLWTPVSGAKALSGADQYLKMRGIKDTWDGKGPVPAAWAAVAPNSSRNAQPMAAILDVMTVLSRAGIKD